MKTRWIKLGIDEVEMAIREYVGKHKVHLKNECAEDIMVHSDGTIEVQWVEMNATTDTT